MQTPSGPLSDRRIVVGVSGGIAAYKSPDLVRRLREAGAQVRVVMTAAATQFVTPLTFQAVSGHPVHCQLLDEQAESGMGHIELARWADTLVIAPATAAILARLAAGLADDLLTTLCLATEAQLVLAPAMNRVMWSHPATQANAALLGRRGALLLGPGEGAQACGEVGAGRMVEPATILAALSRAPQTFAGRRVLVTAGPTLEDIDPVRFLGNRSSGKMGFALAEAFARAGAETVLVAGPVQLTTPAGIAERLDVRSAREMHQAVMDRIASMDVFAGAAAVADFRPRSCAQRKIKKGEESTMTVELVRNRDILAEVAALDRPPFTLGFAAETDALEAHARDKIAAKKVDLIAANLVGGEIGFDSDDNALTVFWAGGCEPLERGSKRALADRLVALVADRIGSD